MSNLTLIPELYDLLLVCAQLSLDALDLTSLYASLHSSLLGQ